MPLSGRNKMLMHAGFAPTCVTLVKTPAFQLPCVPDIARKAVRIPEIAFINPVRSLRSRPFNVNAVNDSFHMLTERSVRRRYERFDPSSNCFCRLVGMLPFQRYRRLHLPASLGYSPQ